MKRQLLLAAALLAGINASPAIAGVPHAEPGKTYIATGRWFGARMHLLGIPDMDGAYICPDARAVDFVATYLPKEIMQMRVYKAQSAEHQQQMEIVGTVPQIIDPGVFGCVLAPSGTPITAVSQYWIYVKVRATVDGKVITGVTDARMLDPE